MRSGQCVCENGEVEKRISLQFLRDVKSVFAQPSGARRKRCDQANLQ
jgi:hypothetical protein